VGDSDAESAQTAWHHRMAMFTQVIPFGNMLLAGSVARKASDYSEDTTKINGLLSQVRPVAAGVGACVTSAKLAAVSVCAVLCPAVDD
jgi:hypothetical protein